MIFAEARDALTRAVVSREDVPGEDRVVYREADTEEDIRTDLSQEMNAAMVATQPPLDIAPWPLPIPRQAPVDYTTRYSGFLVRLYQLDQVHEAWAAVPGGVAIIDDTGDRLDRDHQNMSRQLSPAEIREVAPDPTQWIRLPFDNETGGTRLKDPLWMRWQGLQGARFTFELPDSDIFTPFNLAHPERTTLTATIAIDTRQKTIPVEYSPQQYWKAGGRGWVSAGPTTDKFTVVNCTSTNSIEVVFDEVHQPARVYSAGSPVFGSPYEVVDDNGAPLDPEYWMQFGDRSRLVLYLRPRRWKWIVIVFCYFEYDDWWGSAPSYETFISTMFLRPPFHPYRHNLAVTAQPDQYNMLNWEGQPRAYDYGIESAWDLSWHSRDLRQQILDQQWFSLCEAYVFTGNEPPDIAIQAFPPRPGEIVMGIGRVDEITGAESRVWARVATDLGGVYPQRTVGQFLAYWDV